MERVVAPGAQAEAPAGLTGSTALRHDRRVPGLPGAPRPVCAGRRRDRLDEANETVEFEPVGTHPGYRRQGLARAMLLHGMHRAIAAGARHATVACLGEPAPARELYHSVGFRAFSRDAPLIAAARPREGGRR
ncbi:GNAT family N-acetyltransferase [Amycolatopsis sp. CA-126428]|uniref:GNAT family N-acetyltransferase n=1 Tax=Amycolatopsis sp. CA-126428 TaxID=2073158 RepID=UPI0018ED2C50|nr:GNAT family N-acetyltransferase [Amycolatopsis sp. CA-126428]